MGSADRIKKSLEGELEKLHPKQDLTIEQLVTILDEVNSRELKRRKKKLIRRFWDWIRNAGSIAGLISGFVLNADKACKI